MADIQEKVADIKEKVENTEEKVEKKKRPLWQKILFIVLIVIVALAIAVGIFLLCGGADLLAEKAKEDLDRRQYAIEYLDIEKIREGSEIDEELAAKVDAMPGYGEDDTWGIYIYMVGSDLESYGENDLSEVVQYASKIVADENYEAESATNKERLNNYFEALDDAGLELPSPMYTPLHPEASSTPVTDDVVVADEDGAGWLDIKEILNADIGDNIDIVLQTGGAKRWSSSLINPNRVQRFSIDEYGLTEEESMPTFSMATPEALSDFLTYCEDNHPADHKIIIFWNHGGGSSGYGYDEIFEHMMSLSEMREAFADVYGEDPDEEPFELMDFDACLMASAETLNTLDGYAKYLVASEEFEPGYGQYYTNWISNLSENASYNGAQIGKMITDDYIDFYRAGNMELDEAYHTKGLCLSVIDVHKGKMVYDAYLDLVKKVLEDSCTDKSALTSLARAANLSLHYAGEYYDSINTVDLGILADGICDRYATEGKAIQDAMTDAVLYNRTDHTCKGSQGLTIYFPDKVVKSGSLASLVTYIDGIAEDDALRTLYFYKAAGCLTDEFKDYMEDEGMGELETIDLKSLNDIKYSDAVITEEGNFSISIPKDAADQVQRCSYTLGVLDEKLNTIINYGEDVNVTADGNGNLETSFDGKWLCIEGEPLATEIINNYGDTLTYKAPILLDGKDAYIVISYDRPTDKASIVGAYYTEVTQANGNYIARNISDLKPGMKITPKYVCSNVMQNERTIYGKKIKYGEKTKVGYEKLDNGTYYSAILFSNTRGDEFYSKVISFDLIGSKPVNTMESLDAVYIDD